MNRANPRHLCLLFLAALAAVASSCSDDPASSDKHRAQRRERVEIVAPSVRESITDDMRNSRASVTRILSSANDAVTAPFPGRLELELPAGESESFAGSLALMGFPKNRPVPSARLYFEIDFEGVAPTGASGVRKHSATLGFGEAIMGWTPVQFLRGTKGAVKLTIRGSFIGEDVPAGLDDVRMCLALPEDSVLKPRPDAPNVLLISIDTLRADHLGCYGYARATSPHIDAFVRGGVLFERAYSSAPWTLPSYGSLFTGLLPAKHRAGIVTEREDAWGRDVEPTKTTTELLCRDAPTMAEMFAKHGYQTAGFVSNPFLGSAAGVARGFQSYTSYQYNAQTGVDLALEWMGSRPDSRWFVFLHVIDPHLPYAPPRPYDTRFSATGVDELKDWPPSLDELRTGNPSERIKQTCVDLYDGEIAFVDDQIGRMLDALKASGMLDDTLVVLHSDHGEEFWEHGSCDHGHTQYGELLHVPFALVWPKKLPAKRVATRVRTLDLWPTIAELVGGETPDDIEGKNLIPVIDGLESADRDSLSEGIMHGKRELKSLMVGQDKLVAGGATFNELFDLTADPLESIDRSVAAAELVKTLRDRLLKHQVQARTFAECSSPLALDPSARHQLDKYGYAGDDDGGKAPKAPKKP